MKLQTLFEQQPFAKSTAGKYQILLVSDLTESSGKPGNGNPGSWSAIEKFSELISTKTIDLSSLGVEFETITFFSSSHENALRLFSNSVDNIQKALNVLKEHEIILSVQTSNKIIFIADDIKIEDFKNLPRRIMSSFECDSDHLLSLHNLHKFVEQIDGHATFNCNITSSVLSLLQIKGLKNVAFGGNTNYKIEKIINKYLPEGDIMECQDELMEAGFMEYAKL